MFKNKCIKYKNKYLELKNHLQQGEIKSLKKLAAQQIKINNIDDIINTIKKEVDNPIIDTFVNLMIEIKELVFLDTNQVDFFILNNNLIKLRTLRFGYNFNQVLGPLAGLTNLTTLIFGHRFDQLLDPLALAELENLTTLIFGYSFNQLLGPLARLINLETLIFGDSFNQVLDPLAGLAKLKTLTFGSDFDQSLNNAVDNVHNLSDKIFQNSSKYCEENDNVLLLANK
jgi:hypothetical protein